jgi:hypothetical protein
MTIKTPNIRQFLTHERVVLMACIGIALFFWVLNRLSNSFKKNIPIKLEYVIPSGKSLSVVPPQYAQVMWQGTGWDILAGIEQRIYIQVGNDSIQRISLKDIMVQQFGNDITGVSPEQITVFSEPSKTVTVPVRAPTKIDFAKGFDLADSIELTPSVIEVEGPRTAIDRLIYIQTDTLRFEKLKDSVVTKIKLRQDPLFKLKMTEIKAKIKTEQFTEKLFFIPIVVKNAPQSLRIFPNKIKLDCTVALSLYALLDAENFVAEVDLEHIDFKTKNNTVAIQLTQQPNWVRNIKFSPKSVEFYFEK